MNCIIPFTKDIKFKTTIGEITSISLEHEYNVNSSAILGNFVISGSYKTHELSVNTDDFSFVIPFDVSLSEETIEDTVDFKIDNFTYKVINNNTLKVDIDFKVVSDERESAPLFENVPEELENTVLEELPELNVREEIIDPVVFDNIPELPKEPEVIELELKEESKNISNVEKNAIMNFASSNAETFITYKVHIIKEGETYESISKMYNIDETDLAEYNDLSKLNLNDKVLIPENGN